MKEDHSDAHRRDESDEEEPDSVESSRHRAPVGELVLDNLARRNPTHKDAGEEGAERQQDVRREEVAEVEEALAKDRDINGHRTTASTAHR